MRTFKCISLFTLQFLLFATCFAQREKIDSLKKVWPSLHDNARIDCLNALSEEYIGIQIDTAEIFSLQALEEAKKINYIHGIAEATSLKATVSSNKYNNYSEAENLAAKAILLYAKTLNKKRLNRTYHQLGNALYVQSYFDKAIKYFDTSYDLSKKAGDSLYVFYSVTNSAYAYLEGGNYKKAFERLLDMHQLILKNNNLGWKVWELSLISYLYFSIEDYSMALEYSRKRFQIEKNFLINLIDMTELFSLNKQFDSAKYYYSLIDTSSNERSRRFYLVSIGNYYFLQGQYNKALPNLLRGLRYHKHVNDRNQVMQTLVSVAKTHLALQNNDSAFKYAHEALAIARQTRARQIARDSYKILYSVYNYWKQTDSALYYHERYVAIKDSITTDQTAVKLIAYNFDQKMELLNKEKEIQQVQLQKQSLVKNILVVSILVLLFLSAVIFRNVMLKRRNEKQRLEHQLEVQQLESEIESQQALLNERLRISRDLHDDIGSTLGSISIYSEVAKQRTEKNENTNEVISKIGLASRELIEKMSDIVWSLNPNNERFEQLQNRMMAFAAMILAPRNILYNFIADEELKKFQFTGAQRKNIFLIFKEALYNIVKYADCKTADITLSVQNNDFIMIIKDDGKGFNASRITANEIFSADEYSGGNGIKNMKARANEMNAKLRINSKINEGTTIQLTLHL